MMSRWNRFFTKAFALCLVLVLVLPVQAVATKPNDPVMPCASYYLSAYQTYVCPIGSGKIEVWFDVVGVGTQDELGTLSILVYESSDNENWTWKRSFLHEDYDNMIAYNTNNHMSCVTYQGTAGKYYKAYVGIWGGSDGSGDTRYLWTSSKQAT